MTTYYWVPFQDDDWQYDTLGRMQNGDRMLPFWNGTPANSKYGLTRTAGQWNQVAAGDSLFIAVHGRKYTTEHVAWVVAGGQIINWTVSQMVNALQVMLQGRRTAAIDYHLLACFGANNITPLAKSYGARMAAKMTEVGMRGTLTAYKGATGMLAARGWQTGSSRITAAPHFTRWGDGAGHRTATTADSAKVWNLG